MNGSGNADFSRLLLDLGEGVFVLKKEGEEI